MSIASNFTVNGLFVLTATIAGGFATAKVLEGGFTDFCLGMLTSLISIGLMQQIGTTLRSDQRYSAPSAARIGIFVLILSTFAFVIYCNLLPEPEADPNRFPSFFAEIDSVGNALWYYCLVLGSLTAPWMNADRISPHRNHQHLRSRVVSALGIVLLLGYFIHVVIDASFISGLVDIAIQGVYANQHQLTPDGGELSIDWQGRTPVEFDRFVNIQVFSWASLMLSVSILLVTSSQTFRAATLAITLLGAGILACPAIANLAWLICGAAARLFPIQCETYWQLERPALVLLPFAIALLTVHLATRVTGPNEPKRAIPANNKVVSDSMVTGFLLIVVGFQGVAEVVEYRSSFLSIDTVVDLATAVCYPHLYSGLLLIFFGIHWLWRRRAYDQNRSSLRWPIVTPQQIVIAPLLVVCLTLLVLCSLPFGIALLHFRI